MKTLKPEEFVLVGGAAPLDVDRLTDTELASLPAPTPVDADAAVGGTK